MEDGITAILEALLHALANIFFGGGAAGLTNALTLISQTPAPNLANVAFKAYYAYAYGLAIIVSLFAMVLVLWRGGQTYGAKGPVAALLLVPKTIVGIIILPVAAGLLIMLSELTVTFATALIEPRGLSLQSLTQNLTMASPFSNFMASIAAWFAGGALSIEVTYAVVLVYSLLLCGPLLIALRDVSDFFASMFEIFVGLLLTLIFAKPVITAWLVLAVALQQALPPATPQLTTAYNLINLFVAGLLPIGLYVLYSKKVAPHVGGRVLAGGEIAPRLDGPSDRVKAGIAFSAGAGGFILRAITESDNGSDDTPSGTSRTAKNVAKYAATQATSAVLLAHPQAAAVVKGATTVIGIVQQHRSRSSSAYPDQPVDSTTHEGTDTMRDDTYPKEYLDEGGVK